MDDKGWKTRMRKVRKKQANQKKSPKKKSNWQYKTDEWFDLRERIIQRDRFMCVACGKKSEVFHVHHLIYQKGCKIWEVPDFYLVTLCPGCHIKEHSKRFAIPPKVFT